MTAGGMMRALGMREVRENMRAVVARVEEGEALPTRLAWDGRPGQCHIRLPAAAAIPAGSGIEADKQGGYGVPAVRVGPAQVEQGQAG